MYKSDFGPSQSYSRRQAPTPARKPATSTSSTLPTTGTKPRAASVGNSTLPPRAAASTNSSLATPEHHGSVTRRSSVISPVTTKELTARLAVLYELVFSAPGVPQWDGQGEEQGTPTDLRELLTGLEAGCTSLTKLVLDANQQVATADEQVRALVFQVRRLKEQHEDVASRARATLAKLVGAAHAPSVAEDPSLEKMCQAATEELDRASSFAAQLHQRIADLTPTTQQPPDESSTSISERLDAVVQLTASAKDALDMVGSVQEDIRRLNAAKMMFPSNIDATKSEWETDVGVFLRMTNDVLGMVSTVQREKVQLETQSRGMLTDLLSTIGATLPPEFHTAAKTASQQNVAVQVHTLLRKELHNAMSFVIQLSGLDTLVASKQTFSKPRSSSETHTSRLCAGLSKATNNVTALKQQQSGCVLSHDDEARIIGIVMETTHASHPPENVVDAFDQLAAVVRRLRSFEHQVVAERALVVDLLDLMERLAPEFVEVKDQTSSSGYATSPLERLAAAMPRLVNGLAELKSKSKTAMEEASAAVAAAATAALTTATAAATNLPVAPSTPKRMTKARTEDIDEISALVDAVEAECKRKDIELDNYRHNIGQVVAHLRAWAHNKVSLEQETPLLEQLDHYVHAMVMFSESLSVALTATDLKFATIRDTLHSILAEIKSLVPTAVDDSMQQQAQQGDIDNALLLQVLGAVSTLLRLHVASTTPRNAHHQRTTSSALIATSPSLSRASARARAGSRSKD